MALYALGDSVPHIDPAAFVHPDATVIGNVTIGAESTVWPHAVLRGDYGYIEVGARTSIQDGTVIHVTSGFSGTIVGANCTVGHAAIIHACTVEDFCLIGMGAILLDGCRIGSGSLVGAGALVTPGTDIPPGSLVLGSPAKVKRLVNVKEREQIETGAEHYVELTRRYLAAGREPSLP